MNKRCAPDIYHAGHSMTAGGIIMFDSIVHYEKPSTDRVKKRYAQLFEARPCIDSQRALFFTDYLRNHWDEPLYLRTAGAYRHILSNLSTVIWEDELIVGSTSRYLKGAQLYPEHFEQFYNYISSFTCAEASGKKHRYKRGSDLLSCSLSSEEMNNLKRIGAFWKDKHWHDLCSAHLQETFCMHEHADTGQYGHASLFFAQHIPGEPIAINYKKILQQGLDQILHSLQKHITSLETLEGHDSSEKILFYKCLVLSIQGIIIFAQRYAHEAERQAKICMDAKRKQELYEIARICTKVPKKPPDTFREAIQSFWFMHICLSLELNGRVICPGHFDQYMNPFFERDLSSGVLSETEALELLELFRIKCGQIIIAKPTGNGDVQATNMHQHIILASSDENESPSDTVLSKFMLQARINIHTQQPFLAVMWRKNLSDFFKRKVIDCIKTADWCPDIYKGKTGSQEYVEQVIPPVQYHNSLGAEQDQPLINNSVAAAINELIKTHHITIFDLLVKDGLFSKEENSLLEDAFRQKFFHKIVQDYAEIIRQTVHKNSSSLNEMFLSYNIAGIVYPLLTPQEKPHIGNCSIYHDLPPCRRDDLIVAYGLIDLAKTLTIIKKYVHEEAIFTVSEIREAIVSDFEGCETMRHKLLAASSQTKQSPFFEDVLIDLLDTWSAEPNDVTIKAHTSLRRRLKLVKGLSSTT